MKLLLIHRCNDSFIKRIYVQSGSMVFPENRSSLAIATIACDSMECIAFLSIEKFCSLNRISYIGLPKYCHASIKGSYSHALGLQWAYHRLFPKYEYIAFLDHDIFPTESYSFLKKLEQQSFYGLKQVRGNRWYLWAGFQAFSIRDVKTTKLDFFPCRGLDTGGGNWQKLFSFYDSAKCQFATQLYARLSDLVCRPRSEWQFLERGSIDTEELVSRDNLVENIDGWIHIFNGSNWRNNKDTIKEKNISSVLRGLFNENVDLTCLK